MARIALLLLAFAALAGCADGAGDTGSLTPRLNGRAGFYTSFGSGIGR